MQWTCALVMLLQACYVYGQWCTRPESVNPLGTSLDPGVQCEDGQCDQSVDGEICHCQLEFDDLEADPLAGAQNKVRAVIKKKRCWEEDYGEGWQFYDDCDASSDDDCRHEDRIEICYSDNIDAAQAMCRQFNKGDAFNARASASRRRPRKTVRAGKRTHLATLDCPQHAENLKQCRLVFDDSVTSCPQMVAQCFFSACWQAEHVLRASVADRRWESYNGVDTGRSGIVRYGQKCKNVTEHGGVCGNHCFRCPRTWEGDSRDGLNCFDQNSYTQGNLIWEPHFRTLDGKHYDFQGKCSYYLIKNAVFSIVAKFGVCGKKGVTCVQEIEVNSGLTKLRMGQGNDFTITYRGRKFRRARKPFHNDDINYYLASSEFDAVDVWNGFKILWDRKAEYKMVIPSWNVNINTRGLLGNKNGDPEDDMIKPNGQLAMDPLEFGNSWMVPDSCPPGVSAEANPNPILTSQEKLAAWDEGCKFMNPFLNNSFGIPDPFHNCTSAKAMLERREEFNNCIVDMATCFSDRDPSDCLCPSFEFLADYCQELGEGVGNWRAKMPNSLCKMNCDQSKGEVFRMDADPCTQTCDAIKYVKNNVFDCIKMSVEGCNCEEGKARDRTGKCIPIEECP